MSLPTPRPGAPALTQFLRIESPTILTKEETTDLLRLKTGQNVPMPEEATPPGKIVTANKRQLVFPMPGLSPCDLVRSFSDNTHHPRLDAGEELRKQAWFNTPTPPAWVSCDLSVYPNDGSKSKNTLVVPEAQVLTAIMLIALAQKLPPMKSGFATFACSSVTEEGYYVYLCLHNGLIRYIPVSKNEARRHHVLKVATAS